MSIPTLLAAVLLLSLPALPQNKPANREAESFRLTMPRIQATIAAYSDLIELLAADPALAAKFRAAKEALPDTNGRDTISQTVQQLQAREKRLTPIFTKAGTTPKEAGMTMECLIGVILGNGLLQGQNADTAKLPPYVAENLAFYRQNKAEVEAAFNRFTAVSAKAAKVLEEKEPAEEKPPR